MTVTYTHQSHTAGCIGGLGKLLFIWKGSLIKQILPEMILYFGIYGALSAFYRFVLLYDENAKVTWELWCVYCEKFSKVIPISFLLGFYVTQVVSRWWAQFMSIPWPDTLARYLVVYLPGKDKRSRELRRTIIRWVNLGNTLALRLVSYKVMLRFPTYEHLIESGLSTQKEILLIKKLEDTFNHRHQISWYPTMWAQNLLRTARKEGLIANDWFTHVMIKEIDAMANLNGMLICYAWISIPLVYTQVVTLAVYSYFIACMFGRQYLLPTQYKAEGTSYVPVSEFPTIANWTQTAYAGSVNLIGYDTSLADFYVPCFTILEYLFYLGWLKVAETLLNPFGEDDDDFDTYYLIDRNLQVSLVMAEEAGRHLELEPDPLNDQNPSELKHTVISSQFLDDCRPHMPTDDIVLDHDQVQITDSAHTSKMNLNIESKLSLAGSMLSTPVTMHKLISYPGRLFPATKGSGTSDDLDSKSSRFQAHQTSARSNKLESGGNLDKKEDIRYPGRITNGRMLSGRMSVTEVIPEPIPEEPADTCLINIEENSNLLGTSDNDKTTDQSATVSEGKDTKKLKKPAYMRIRPVSSEIKDEEKEKIKAQPKDKLIPSICVVPVAGLVTGVEPAVPMLAGQCDGDGGEEMADMPDGDIIDGDW